MKPLITVEDVHVEHRAAIAGEPAVRAVHGVSFMLNTAAACAFVGEQGAGKTSLARAVVGLPPGLVQGEVSVRAGVRLHMLFRGEDAGLNPRWKLRKIISEPVLAQGSRKTRNYVFERLDALLAQVGLSAEDASKRPLELAPVARRRASIARALAAEADLIICDEPTYGLDATGRAQILNLLRDLRAKYGLAYIVMCADIAEARYLADEICILRAGRMIEAGAADKIAFSPAHPYTRRLAAAAQRVFPSASALSAPLDPAAPDAQTGCPYRLRCPEPAAICASTRPAMREWDQRLVACHLYDHP